MAEIRTKADIAFRDWETDGVPSFGAQKVEKQEARETFAVTEDFILAQDALEAAIRAADDAALDTRVDDLENSITSSLIGAATWDILKVKVGGFDGQIAEVPAEDSGNHTGHDRDSGASTVAGVANTGRYIWDTSIAVANKWRWISVDAISAKANSLNAELLGIPTAPTAAAGTSSTQIASTAFATAAAAAASQVAIDLNMAPIDAVGLWDIASYNSTSRFIPNLVAVSPTPSLNLKRMSRHAFNSVWYNKSGVTVLDRSQIGVSGDTDASLITGVGNWKLAFGSTSGTIPAGTYTIGADIMRGVGSDQPFGFTKDGGATRSSVQTATSAFQRFLYTFTLASPTTNLNLGLVSSDGSTDATLIVDNIELFSGSSDLGPLPPTNGHIYVGQSHAATAPSFSGGILSSALQNVSACQLPERYSFSTWTHSMLVQQSSVSTSSAMLFDIASYLNFAMHGGANLTGSGATPAAAAGGGVMLNKIGSQAGLGQRGGLLNFVGQNYHLLTHTYDGVAEEFWYDDIRIVRWEHTLPALNLQDLQMFVTVAPAAPGLNIAGLMGLWDRALSATEIRGFLAQQRARLPSLTVPIRDDRILIVEGDSNHGAQDANAWPFVFTAHDNPPNIGALWSVLGTRLDHTTDATLSALPALSDRLPYLLSIIPPATYGRKFIVTIGVGTNDLDVYSSVANYITAYRAMTNALVAAGFIVIPIPVPPVLGSTSLNTKRATFNTDLLTNWALYGVADASHVPDFTADSFIGLDNSASLHPTYWHADGKHLIAPGSAVLESYLQPIIDSIT